MLPQDTLIETFLYYPSKTLLSTITNKELAITLFKKLPDSATKYYLLWTIDSNNISMYELIKTTIKENNITIYNIFKDRMSYKCKCRYIKLAAQYASKDIYYDLISRGAIRYKEANYLEWSDFDLYNSEYYRRWSSLVC